ncbi:MAG: alpha-L-fucosidase [Planctomycetota bacterium]|nr:alpha-L-fucosidase [Planctomycetota bacterium]MDP7251846.1 alpha-L-fucosidase [Planctomycetota bacterium]
MPNRIPAYMSDFAGSCASSPRTAAREWFAEAKLGLFLHYGLYSIPGGEWNGQQVFNRNNADQPVAEWIQFHGLIPVADYAKLKDSFTAEKFDADFITDLAIEAEMKYVNITTRHHDSFCLFETAETEFNSVNSPARRDLVKELAEQCQKKGLGLFLYYSHGRDWKHPHAPTRDWGGTARPAYDQRPPEYLDDHDVDLGQYISFLKSQITELLTHYGPIAGIWLDGEGVLKKYGDLNGGLDNAIELLQVHELYEHIRNLQPQCLVSYKQGVTGTEDFLTPERTHFGLGDKTDLLEINTTIQEHSWGYNKFTRHRKDAEELMDTLRMARTLPANLLLNTGPRADGSLVEEEVNALRDLGHKIRNEGWPSG